MKTKGAISAVVLASCAVLGGVGPMPPAHAVTIDWATVGNPGNAPNTAFSPAYGAVGYEYRIAKYDVTISQYTSFLNAVAASDPYALWNRNMSSNLNIAGISRTGASGSYTYSVIGSSGNKPITYVSWFDAARFANWMHNGQGSGGTETGAYTLVSGQTNGVVPARNPGAQFYIPTEDEWYKAAYYSPVKGGTGSPGYYLYATQSDLAPGNVVGSGSNQANYVKGGYAVTQSPTYVPSQNYLTDVGAFANSASYYGTFDQSGNVFQWNDSDGLAGTSRGIRGGYWGSTSSSFVSSMLQGIDDGSAEGEIAGFRLASPAAVPEIDPAGLSSVLAFMSGSLGLLERRRRSRR